MGYVYREKYRQKKTFIFTHIFMLCALMFCGLGFAQKAFSEGKITPACRTETSQFIEAMEKLQPVIKPYVQYFIQQKEKSNQAIKLSDDQRKEIEIFATNQWCADIENKLSAKDITFLKKLHNSDVMKRYTDEVIGFWFGESAGAKKKVYEKFDQLEMENKKSKQGDAK